MRWAAIFATALFAGSALEAGQVTALPALESSVFSVSSSSLLWYFKGEAPPNYGDTMVLSAVGPTQGSFQWIPRTNGSFIKLIATQENNRIIVGSQAPSLEPQDVDINLKYNGNDVGSVSLTVFAPSRAELLPSIQNVPAGNFLDSGFNSFATYEFFDQFGGQLPYSMPLNESFGTTFVTYPGGSNWPSGLTPNGVFTRVQTPSFFTDTYGRYNNLWTPQPQVPGSPLSTVSVFSVIQTYNAGSTTSGAGLLFSSQVVNWYLDHADVVK